MIKKIIILIIVVVGLLAWQKGYLDGLKNIDWKKMDQVWTAVKKIDLPKTNQVVNDFNSCVSAGNPVMESYPRQCSANGQVFTEVIK